MSGRQIETRPGKAYRANGSCVVRGCCIAGLVWQADHYQMSLEGRLHVGSTSAFEACLLGPVQLVRATVRSGWAGRGPRAVLALLVLEAGRVVPAGRLVEEIWQVTCRRGWPRRCDLMCRACGRYGRRTPRWRRAGGGYVLSVDAGVIDAVQFK
jgi:hypothetical protein